MAAVGHEPGIPSPGENGANKAMHKAQHAEVVLLDELLMPSVMEAAGGEVQVQADAAEDTQRLQTELDSLRKAITIINSLAAEYDIQRAMDNVRQVVLDLLGCERVTLFLLFERRQELRAVAQGPSGEQLIKLKFGQGIAGTVARTGQLMNIADAYMHPLFNSVVDTSTGFRTRNMLCCAISDMTDRNVAVLQALNKQGGGMFTEADERSIVLVGTHLGNTLSRAKLHEAAQRERQRVVDLYTCFNAMAAADHLNELLLLARVALHDVLHAEHAFVFLMDAPRNELWTTFTVLGSTQHHSARVAVGQGVVGQAAADRQPRVFTVDGEVCTLVHPTSQPVASSLVDGPLVSQITPALGSTVVQSVLVQPLVSTHGKLMGAILAINKQDSGGHLDILHEDQFTQSDVEAMALFALELGNTLAERSLEVSLASVLSTVGHDGAAPGDKARLDLPEDREREDSRAQAAALRAQMLSMYFQEYPDNDNSGSLAPLSPLLSSAEGVRDKWQRVFSRGGGPGRHRWSIPQYLHTDMMPAGGSYDERRSTSSSLLASLNDLRVRSAQPALTSGCPPAPAAEPLASSCSGDSQGATLPGLPPAIRSISHQPSRLRPSMEQQLLQPQLEIGASGQSASPFVLHPPQNGPPGVRVLLSSAESSEAGHADEDLQGQGTGVAASVGTVTPMVSTISEGGPVEPAASHDLPQASFFDPKLICSWDFDLVDFDDTELVKLCYDLFMLSGLVQHFQLNPQTLRSFLTAVASHYHDVPYHNFNHVCHVLHSVFMMMRTEMIQRSLAPEEQLALLIAALCHDLDHDGCSNKYHVNSQSTLAQIYNDVSVLENHHCAMTFAVLGRKECALLDVLEPDVRRRLRKGIVAAILSTDMSHHFGVTQDFKKHAPEYDRDNEADRLLLLKILVHASDVGAGVRPLAINDRLTQRAHQEFKALADKEQGAGLPNTFAVDPSNLQLCAQVERSFFDAVVIPLWECVADVITELRPCYERLLENRRAYHQKATRPI